MFEPSISCNVVSPIVHPAQWVFAHTDHGFMLYSFVNFDKTKALCIFEDGTSVFISFKMDINLDGDYHAWRARRSAFEAF